MAISIVIGTDDENIQQGECLLLDDELIAYLCCLDSIPVLKWLGQVDPYGVTKIQQSIREKFKKELPGAIEQAKNKNLLKPPDYVGLEGGSVDIEFGEKFGWHGLTSFLRKLEDIILSNKPLLAIGD